MTISAKIIAHSRSPFYDHGDTPCPDIITFQLRYPRFIHAEFMTHRTFSRNASSSRAIPVETMIKNIIADTAMPVHWGKNQPGMQADEEQDALIYGSCGILDMVDNKVEGVSPIEAWNIARDRAIEVAQDFHRAGYHKQVVNRILEPFMHIDVIMTTTAPDNFYHLRSHKDAQPEIKVLSDAMLAAHQASTPTQLRLGEWHMPYILEEERGQSPVDLLKMSVARCARVSYLTHDGKKPDFAKDIELYERLVGSTPLHASPAEHQACPDTPIYANNTVMWDMPHLSGNFNEGWMQYRKTLPGEVCQSYEAA